MENMAGRIAVLAFIFPVVTAHAASVGSGVVVRVPPVAGEFSLEHGKQAARPGISAWNGVRKSLETAVSDGVATVVGNSSGRGLSDVRAPAAPTFAPVSYASEGSSTGGTAFDFDGLYRRGAVVAYVWGPVDINSGYREISMKLYSIKQSDGSLLSMIGIVDITDPTHPYPPKLIPWYRDDPLHFQLKRGGREYVFRTWLENGLPMILFARQGAKDGEGGALSTSLEELYRVRADEAADGGLVTIGARRFYTLGQGGSRGSVLFFSKETIDNRSGSADARELRPEAMADVSEVDENGATVPVRGMPNIGVIDGVAYHLERDASIGAWRVAPGNGDRP